MATKSVVVRLRVLPETKAQWERDALERGVSVSALVRSRMEVGTREQVVVLGEGDLGDVEFGVLRSPPRRRRREDSHGARVRELEVASGKAALPYEPVPLAGSGKRPFKPDFK